jgi:hypothetical protein
LHRSSFAVSGAAATGLAGGWPKRSVQAHSSDWKTAIDAADVGAFVYRNQDGLPVACAVTPYLEAGDAVVTSTLALPAKAMAARREGAAALLAGGKCVRGRVEVTVDQTSGEFDRYTDGEDPTRRRAATKRSMPRCSAE